ncbi:MAG: hypothetical protein KAH21_09355 [Spirochaetaceae bacterium]|nr:hypothetical protein [Spirochaetaceae bacterium]
MKIEKINWNGVNSVRFESGSTEMIIVTDYGPRISFFGSKGGRNMLFWDDQDRGRNDWKLRGGHRVWIMTNGADESELTYRADNDPCTVEEDGNSATIWSKLDPVNFTRRGIRVAPASNGNFEVTSLVKNDGEMLLSCGIWTLTCTLPGEETEYAFPLGDDSGWDTFKSVQFRKWGPCDGMFGDSQFQVNQNTFIVKPAGIQAKQMFCIPSGIGCMIDPESGRSFVKLVDYDESADYPEGCNWAMYIGPDNYMVEFETMGPYSTLKPGTQKGHTEIWALENRVVKATKRGELIGLLPE